VLRTIRIDDVMIAGTVHETRHRPCHSVDSNPAGRPMDPDHGIDLGRTNGSCQNRLWANPSVLPGIHYASSDFRQLRLYQIVSTRLASLRFWSAVMMGAFLRMEVAAMSRSAGSLLISDPRLTDSSAISGVIS